MAYREYDGTLPDGTTQTVITVPESTRINAAASIDGLLMGGITKDIDMSIVGDPEMPSVITYSKGASMLRSTLTWDDDLQPTQILYEKSLDTGVSWEVIGTKYVFWASGVVTDCKWRTTSMPPAEDLDFSNAGVIGARSEFSRASIATVIDNYGSIVECLEHEARFYRLRRVNNVAINSDDATSFLVSGSTVLDAGNTFRMPQGGSVSIPSSPLDASLRRWTGSLRLRAGAASDIGRAVTLKVQGNGADVNDAATIAVTLTEAYTRYAVTGLPAQIDDWSHGVRLTIENTDADDALLYVDIFEPQLEDVSARPTNEPSEYVSSVAYHGAGVMGVKYFTTENGNTTSGGIVSSAPGSAITGERGLVTERGATNLLLNSTDLTTTTDDVEMASGQWYVTNASAVYEYDGGNRSIEGDVRVMRITPDDTQISSPHGIWQKFENTGTTGVTNFVASVAVKRLGTLNPLFMKLDDGGVSEVLALTLLENGTIDQADNHTWAAQEDLGDGWVRLMAGGVSTRTGGGLEFNVYHWSGSGGASFLMCAPQVIVSDVQYHRATYMPSYAQAGIRSSDLMRITTPDVYSDATYVSRIALHYDIDQEDDGVMFSTQDSRGSIYESSATAAAAWGFQGSASGVVADLDATAITADTGMTTYVFSGENYVPEVTGIEIKTLSNNSVFKITISDGDSGALANTQIDWGDGTATSETTNPQHTYATPGTYVVTIDGVAPKLSFSDVASAKMVSRVVQGGQLGTETCIDMFKGCDAMTSVDLTGLDTSAATSMHGMFEGCIKVTSINMAGLDTSSVTNTSLMFQNCYILASLDISGFDFRSAGNMSSMFRSCTKLKSIDLSSFNISSASSISSMFYYCSELESVDLSGITSNEIIYASTLFFGCQSLTSIDISYLDLSLVQNFTGLFRQCDALTSVELPLSGTPSATTMEQMFEACHNLKSVDLSPLTTASVTIFNDMFQYCWELENISGSFIGDAHAIRYTTDMFNDAVMLNQVSLDSILEEIYNNRHNYFWTGALALDLTSPTSWPSGTYQYANPPITGNEHRYWLINDPDGEGFKTWDIQVNTAPVIAAEIEVVTPSDNSVFQITINDGDSGALASSQINWGDGTETSETTNPQHTYATAGTYVVTIDGAAPKLSFSDAASAQMVSRVLQGGSLGTETCVDMFSGCSNLTSADLTGLDTIAVTSMNGMFRSCASLTSVTLTELTTVMLTDMGDMFIYCSSLPSIQLSSIDTSRVTNLSGMFLGCTSLTSVSLQFIDTSSVVTMLATFSGCESLWSANLNGADLTSATNFDSLFRECHALTNVYLYDTLIESVTDMGHMFYNCHSLQSINLSDLDFGSVTDMENMFASCEALETLTGDVIGGAHGIQNIDGMFLDAFSLSQGSLDTILEGIHNNRQSYTNGRTLDLTSPTASPSGTYQYANPPTTGNEYRYWVMNDPDGEGFKLWSISVNAAQLSDLALDSDSSAKDDTGQIASAAIGAPVATPHDLEVDAPPDNEEVVMPLATGHRLNRMLVGGEEIINSSYASNNLDHSNENSVTIGCNESEGQLPTAVHAYFAIYGGKLTDAELLNASNAAGN